MKILVTGGAGFIGSNFIRYVLNKYPDYQIVNLDKLTYCGNLDNLRDIEDNPRYHFIKGDVCDKKIVEEGIQECQAIVHFAAETHVDRSIMEAGTFVVTDVLGTHVLLETAKKFKIERMIHIGTDESYGSIEKGSFKEGDALVPSSPYSASKAAADLLVHAYWATYNLPVIITRSSNNFGPYQYPEKLIPLFITNALDDEPLPLYGDGKNVRDWIYVIDNCEAIDFVLHQGKLGEVYNIGGGNERTNLEITEMVLDELGKTKDLISFVTDRPGHDQRYSLNTAKLRQMGWQPKYDFKQALGETVKWYRENEWWWRKIKSGEFQEYYQQMYKTQTHPDI